MTPPVKKGWVKHFEDLTSALHTGTREKIITLTVPAGKSVLDQLKFKKKRVFTSSEPEVFFPTYGSRKKGWKRGKEYERVIYLL